MRYEVQDRFIWRYESPEDTAGKLLCFVFDPDDAVDLAAMMNTAVSLAEMVIQDCQPHDRAHVNVTEEDVRLLAGVFGGIDPEVASRLQPRSKDDLYTWDGEPGA